jgi:hypothetical protein
VEQGDEIATWEGIDSSTDADDDTRDTEKMY